MASPGRAEPRGPPVTVRDQGLTVDQAVLVVDCSTGAEHVFVGMTRGRHHNLARVITEPAGDEHTASRQPPER